MKIIWTRSPLPISVLIRKVTKEPVSHVAILYHGIVIHADFYGVRFTEESHFRKANEVVFEVDVKDDDEKVLRLLKKNHGKSYDFGALIFLGISLTLRHYFKIPMPKSNLWQSSGMFICSEWASLVVNEKADSMITPYGLYLLLSRSNN